MKARLPDRSGSVTRDDVRVFYDVYGEGNAPTVLLLPSWAVATSELWKLQVPVLSRRHRVVVIEGRGNGRSDRPKDPMAHTATEHVGDAIAVLDATATEAAVVAGVSLGAARAAAFAANHPDRALGAVMIAPAIGLLVTPLPVRTVYSFFDELDEDEGWALFNEHAWRRDFGKFAEFFWSEVFTEPHSTKAWEDGVGWQLGTDAETLIATAYAPGHSTREEVVDELNRIACPTLVIHGSNDHIASPEIGDVVSDITGGDLLVVEGGGHCPQVRDPIRVNRALLEFVERVTPPPERQPRRATWTHALARPKKVLYLSSPIGLGHARRDLAIVRALRDLHGDVQVEWLTQHPVTELLAGTGERIHPASTLLVSESAHITSESHEHDLYAFQAIRRMDEILLANFSLLQDVVDDGDFDLVVGDEAWDADYFWHENPELKRTSYVWMTDFVGWLPMPEGGSAEAALTADYNAEMIEHVERFRRIRDRAVFVGDPDDIVGGDFGPGLPSIRDWTERHYDFCGYITGIDPATVADRSALRERLGYAVDAPVVVVTVGGAGVGEALLRKVIDAFPMMRKQVDDLQLLVVAGPRIDPASLPPVAGAEITGYLPDLPLHLAACDAAIVQGGLTTSMELVAADRPFLYFPLGRHFEQQRHVRHRLDRHRAGRCLDYRETDAEALAAALVEEMQRPRDYLPVPADGADRAARILADLL